MGPILQFVQIRFEGTLRDAMILLLGSNAQPPVMARPSWQLGIALSPRHSPTSGESPAGHFTGGLRRGNSFI